MVLSQFLLPNLLPGCAQGKPNGVEKKNGNCGNAIAENGEKKSYEICERVKKRVVTSTIFLQHFHNKSHMISYY